MSKAIFMTLEEVRLIEVLYLNGGIRAEMISHAATLNQALTGRQSKIVM